MSDIHAKGDSLANGFRELNDSKKLRSAFAFLMRAMDEAAEK